MSIILALHALAAVVWVGGMFFAVVCLRPSTSWMDGPVRLRLWAHVLSRFFRWVGLAAAVLLGTGLYIVLGHIGSLRAAGSHVHIMFALGLVMMLMAAHVYFAPYKRLKRFVTTGNWAEAGKQMQQIRLFINFNLALGLVVVVVGSGGRFWH
ncbi:MAG TPA: CopD family protein [Solimonas sp.]|nr:CopD family protein [Solimonas sp.]